MFQEQTTRNTIGDAPCACGRHAWGIVLIPGSKEPDGKGGFWWQCKPGQSCPECNEPHTWYHQPAPVAMPLFFVMRETEEAEVRFALAAAKVTVT